MVRILWIAVVLTALTALVGCTTWRGLRLDQRGTRALEAGHVEAALADLERAAELAPRASEIQNHLGIARLRAGRPLAAAVAFQRAVDLDCANRGARENLARAQLLLEHEAAVAAVATPGAEPAASGDAP